MSDTEDGGATTSGKGMETLMRMLLEDRKAREDDMARERERREAAEARYTSQMAEQLEICSGNGQRTVVRWRQWQRRL